MNTPRKPSWKHPNHPRSKRRARRATEKTKRNDHQGVFENHSFGIFEVTQKVNLLSVRKCFTKNDFLLQFSVALLALRFFRGAIWLSQLRHLG